MGKNVQEIYVNLDDSGKLTNKEHVSVYGGLVFFSKKEKDKFITQYRSIIKSIKCNYCKKDKNNCDGICVEIKNTNIKNSHKRRLMNYIKKYYVIALIIKNDNVYAHIKESKAAKGRFLDYSIRRMIKELINKLIKDKKIDSYEPIKLIINIDQQSTKNNGYYNLHDGLVEELKYGISNYNYFASFKPIVFSDLEVMVKYHDSEKSYVVQAADLIAGTIRKIAISNLDKDISVGLNNFVNFSVVVP